MIGTEIKEVFLSRPCNIIVSRLQIEMIKSDNIEETIKHVFKIVVKEALEDKLSKGCVIVNATIELAPHDKDVAAIN